MHTQDPYDDDDDDDEQPFQGLLGAPATHYNHARYTNFVTQSLFYIFSVVYIWEEFLDTRQ
jgi:hypothetical protein